MVIVNGKQLSAWPETESFKPDAFQKDLFNTLVKSTETYRYEDIAHLITELKLRSSIVAASKALNQSGFQFKIFRESIANPDYWYRGLNGGFQLRSDVKPSDAIRDIFKNGSKYGTECSTAMQIVWYKALLDIMPEDKFNRLYSNIYLMNWLHMDRDLALAEFKKPVDTLPGDAGYFQNPDVNPLTPEWQGENVFYLGNGQYYGHGVGIRDAAGLIRVLNAQRKAGATVSAFKTDFVKRQNYAYISKFINS